MTVPYRLLTITTLFSSGVFNFEGCRLPVYSAWNIQYLRQQLFGYTDAVVAELLQFGFPIGYDSAEMPQSDSMTHKGALNYPVEVNCYLGIELTLGATLGPFSVNPLQAKVTVSPLNTVDKDHGAKRRVILDLSWPKGYAVNDGINKDWYLDEEVCLTYPTVETLLDIIRNKGPGCLLFKRDLRRAYRQIPVDPGDIHLLGYLWEGQLYIDRVFPFGLRSAAFVCQRVTSALAYIARMHGVDCVNYLDDFGGADVPECAMTSYVKLGGVLQAAGAEESVEKASPPSTVMTFLGIELDTVAMEMRVPEEKLKKLRSVLPLWLHKHHCSKRELQSIIGCLSFISKCVAPGRLFLNRMLQCLRGLPVHEMEHKIVLSLQFHKDIQWWITFIEQFNGVAIIKTDPWLDANVLFSTDACLVGCGGICGNRYFHSTFPPAIRNKAWPIAVLECMAIVVAAKLWAPEWTGQRITVACDNLATVILINSGMARHTALLSCLRELAFIAAVNEFEFRAVHNYPRHT